MLALKVALFTVFVPGTVVVYVPYRLLAASRSSLAPPADLLSAAALVPILLGAVIYFRCVWDFAAAGHGTPAPIDPPKVLVVRGPYRYVRNPMYLGVLLVMLGEALLFRASVLVEYAALGFLFIHVFVAMYEEPTLSAKFGESYDQYRRSVPRWIPRLRPRAGSDPLPPPRPPR